MKTVNPVYDPSLKPIDSPIESLGDAGAAKYLRRRGSP